jgi:hypothetical protein
MPRAPKCKRHEAAKSIAVVLAMIDIHNVVLRIESKVQKPCVVARACRAWTNVHGQKGSNFFATCKCIDQALINVSPAALFDILEEQSNSSHSNNLPLDYSIYSSSAFNEAELVTRPPSDSMRRISCPCPLCAMT